MDITFEEWREKCKNSKVERRTDYIGWDEYFMEIAKLSARRSKDPARQGACEEKLPSRSAWSEP